MCVTAQYVILKSVMLNWAWLHDSWLELDNQLEGSHLVKAKLYVDEERNAATSNFAVSITRRIELQGKCTGRQCWFLLEKGQRESYWRGWTTKQHWLSGNDTVTISTASTSISSHLLPSHLFPSLFHRQSDLRLMQTHITTTYSCLNASWRFNKCNPCSCKERVRLHGCVLLKLPKNSW